MRLRRRRSRPSMTIPRSPRSSARPTSWPWRVPSPQRPGHRHPSAHLSGRLRRHATTHRPCAVAHDDPRPVPRGGPTGRPHHRRRAVRGPRHAAEPIDRARVHRSSPRLSVARRPCDRARSRPHLLAPVSTRRRVRPRAAARPRTGRFPVDFRPAETGRTPARDHEQRQGDIGQSRRRTRVRRQC